MIGRSRRPSPWIGPGLAAILAALMSGCDGPVPSSGSGGANDRTVAYSTSYFFRPPPTVGPRFSAQRLSWSPDGTEIAVSDQRCEGVRIFTADGKYLRTLGDSAPWFARLESPMGVAYSPDGKQIVVTDMGNHRAAIFKTSGEFITLLKNKDDPEIHNPWDVAYSPDGEIIAVNNGRLYDKTGKFLRSLPVGGVGVSFFPDGQTLAFIVGAGQPRIRIVDLQGETLGRFGAPMNPGQEKIPGLLHHPMGVACSPDGKTVAVVDERQHRLLLFDAQGTLLHSWDGGEGRGPEGFGMPRGVAFARDGSKIAITDAKNERVIVFNIPQKRLMTPKGNP